MNAPSKSWDDFIREYKEFINKKEIKSDNLSILNDLAKDSRNISENSRDNEESSDSSNFSNEENILINLHENDVNSTQNMYDDGTIGQCYISHVIDESESLCYIIDATQMPDTRSFFENRIRPLNRLPRNNEIFAYNFDRQFMIRAKRIDEMNSSINNSSYSAYFIDIGCTISIDMNDIEYFFEIDETVKEIPSCALQCKVIKMPSDRSLLTSLHSKMNFHIKKTGNEFLYVELSADEMNPFEPSLIVSNTNFYSYFEWNWDSQQQQQQQQQQQKSIECDDDFQNNFQVNLEHFDGVQVFTKKKSKRNLIRQILSERYDMDNDKNKINDELSGKWKAHTERMEEFADSLTYADDDNVDINEENDPVRIVVPPSNNENLFPIQFWPKVGDTIKIKTYFVRDIERFYAFIPTCYDEHTMTPDKLTTAMNIQENRNSYIKCKRLPNINELIFAIFCGQVYRARVVKHYDSVYFQVFFIDFGNCSKVCLNDGVFRWDARWNHIPPLSISCTLNNVKKDVEFDFMSIHLMESILLNKTLEANVVEVNQSMDSNALVLNVKDKDGQDMAEILIAKGFSQIE